MNYIKKQNRGITLISLIGYVVLTIMVLGALIGITTMFRRNFSELNTRNST